MKFLWKNRADQPKRVTSYRRIKFLPVPSTPPPLLPPSVPFPGYRCNIKCEFFIVDHWRQGNKVSRAIFRSSTRRRFLCVCMYIYIYRERAVYILSVEQVSTEQRRDTKFRKTFRFPLISSPRVFVIRRFFQTQLLSRTPADPWTGSNSPEDGASSSVNTVSITFLPRSFRFPDESIRALSIQPRLPRA